ncbi:hypothetical protein [Acinetobacter sp. WZC-1]|uniref:hypothetical protein n=1 Tax=Acinetobacter sp. WZC-1 TaxID=3459034 RepID=UPI00403DD9E7
MSEYVLFIQQFTADINQALHPILESFEYAAAYRPARLHVTAKQSLRPLIKLLFYSGE